MYINLTTDYLLKSGVLIGHEKKHRETEMNYYLSITANLIDYMNVYHIINQIRRTELILTSLGYRNGILFVGTQNTSCFSNLLYLKKKFNFFFICSKWEGGTLTNFKRKKFSLLQLILGRIRKLSKNKLISKIISFTPKQIHNIQKLFRQNLYFIGIKYMFRLPDLIISASSEKDKLMIHETNFLMIPLIGIIDTNCKPNTITYPIPGNDDSTVSIIVLIQILLRYVRHGKKSRHTFFYIKYKELQKQVLFAKSLPLLKSYHKKSNLVTQVPLEKNVKQKKVLKKDVKIPKERLTSHHSFDKKKY